MTFKNMTTKQGFSQGLSIGQFFVSAVVASAIIGGFAGVALASDGSAGLGVEVNINGSGNALVRGAEVSAVSGTDVSAKTSLGSSVMNWLVKIDSNTEFSANHDGAVGIANIAVGDIISFRGAIDQSVAGLTVKAKHVKEWTKKETKTRLNGTVQSINTSLHSIVVANGNSTTTVETNGSTKFSTNGHASTFADLFLNAKVKILGMFNASSTIFTASNVEIASSTKDKWTKDDAHAWRDWIRSMVWLHVR